LLAGQRKATGREALPAAKAQWGGLIFDKIRQSVPGRELIWADSGYNAHQVNAAVAKVPSLRIEIVKRGDAIKGFVVSARRWVIERTFSWFGRNRRLAGLGRQPCA
jgi:transposase